MLADPLTGLTCVNFEGLRSNLTTVAFSNQSSSGRLEYLTAKHTHADDVVFGLATTS